MDTFLARVDALGTTATPEQAAAIVEFIVANFDRTEWDWARNQAIFVDGVYSAIGERLGEFGE